MNNEEVTINPEVDAAMIEAITEQMRRDEREAEAEAQQEAIEEAVNNTAGIVGTQEVTQPVTRDNLVEMLRVPQLYRTAEETAEMRRAYEAWITERRMRGLESNTASEHRAEQREWEDHRRRTVITQGRQGHNAVYDAHNFAHTYGGAQGVAFDPRRRDRERGVHRNEPEAATPALQEAAPGIPFAGDRVVEITGEDQVIVLTEHESILLMYIDIDIQTHIQSGGALKRSKEKLITLLNARAADPIELEYMVNGGETLSMWPAVVRKLSTQVRNSLETLDPEEDGNVEITGKRVASDINTEEMLGRTETDADPTPTDEPRGVAYDPDRQTTINNAVENLIGNRPRARPDLPEERMTRHQLRETYIAVCGRRSWDEMIETQQQELFDNLRNTTVEELEAALREVAEAEARAREPRVGPRTGNDMLDAIIGAFDGHINNLGTGRFYTRDEEEIPQIAEELLQRGFDDFRPADAENTSPEAEAEAEGGE